MGDTLPFDIDETHYKKIDPEEIMDPGLQEPHTRQWEENLIPGEGSQFGWKIKKTEPYENFVEVVLNRIEEISEENISFYKFPENLQRLTHWLRRIPSKSNLELKNRNLFPKINVTFNVSEAWDILKLNTSWDRIAKEKINNTLQLIQESQVLISNHTDLVDYFKEYPGLVEIITVACRGARNEFGEQVQLSLEIFFDPESDDKYPTLYVRQEKYESNILDRIEKVSESIDPFLEQTKGWFLITTDFQSPK